MKTTNRTSDEGDESLSVEGLGRSLYVEIDSNKEEIKAPPASLALLWLSQQALSLNELKFCNVVLSETLTRRTAAAGVPGRTIIDGMGLSEGMGSKQTLKRTQDALINKGVLHVIRGHQRKATVMWLGWVNEAVAAMENDKFGAGESLALLDELRREAETRYVGGRGAKAQDRDQAHATLTDDAPVMPAGGEPYASRDSELRQQRQLHMDIGRECVSLRNLPTYSSQETPVNRARVARTVDRMNISEAARTTGYEPRRLDFGIKSRVPIKSAPTAASRCRWHGDEYRCDLCRDTSESQLAEATA